MREKTPCSSQIPCASDLAADRLVPGSPKWPPPGKRLAATVLMAAE